VAVFVSDYNLSNFSCSQLQLITSFGLGFHLAICFKVRLKEKPPHVTRKLLSLRAEQLVFKKRSAVKHAAILLPHPHPVSRLPLSWLGKAAQCENGNLIFTTNELTLY
jgi:hypothetical protein